MCAGLADLFRRDAHREAGDARQSTCRASRGLRCDRRSPATTWDRAWSGDAPMQAGVRNGDAATGRVELKDGQLYGAGVDRKVYAVDLETGEVQWSSRLSVWWRRRPGLRRYDLRRQLTAGGPGVRARSVYRPANLAGQDGAGGARSRWWTALSWCRRSEPSYLASTRRTARFAGDGAWGWPGSPR